MSVAHEPLGRRFLSLGRLLVVGLGLTCLAASAACGSASSTGVTGGGLVGGSDGGGGGATAGGIDGGAGAATDGGASAATDGGAGGAAVYTDPVSAAAGSPITGLRRAADGTVSGSMPDPIFGPLVFSVRATSETSAEARMELLGIDVNVTLADPDHARTVIYGSMEYDGAGPIGQIESTYLTILIGYPLFAQVPLELGCGTGLAPVELAALLVPFQLALKYLPDRASHVTDALAKTTCDYRAGLPELASTRPPAPGPIAVGDGDLVPVVFGFFPFAAQGASEPAGVPHVVGGRFLVVGVTGPCGSKCRGACGADCPFTCNRSAGPSDCEKDASGNNTGYLLNTTDFDCGTHIGCIEHDACYDTCNGVHGCDTFASSVCMHGLGGCDRAAGSSYGYSTGAGWAAGFGPYSGRETFRYTTSRVLSTSACGGGGGECVVAGTPVTLADGQRVAIETVRVGAWLATVDGASGSSAVAEVEDVYVHREGPYLVDRLVGLGGTTLDVTPHHPVWTTERGYTTVAELTPGDHLLKLDPETGAVREVTLVSIVRAVSHADVVYNLKTSRSSYLAADVLVHNKCVAAGSLVDSPAGPLPVERLRPGDVVWGEVEGRRVATRVWRTFEKSTVLGSLPGKRLAPGLSVTVNHQVAVGGAFLAAGSLDAPDGDVVGTVYDLETGTGNYFARGVLLKAAGTGD